MNGAFLFLVLVLNARLDKPDLMAIFGAIVFVSVLVHELGHAIVGRAFGLSPVIELNGMGGVTSWTDPRTLTSQRSIAISLAGPFAGFLLAGGLLLAGRLGFYPHTPRMVFAFEQALFVNLAWGVFNLAPMLPLDGGNVLRSVLDLLTKGRGDKPARVVSIVTGGLFLVYAVLAHQWWLGALAAFYSWANLLAFRQVDTRRADLPLADAIQKAYVALEKHEGAVAIELLRPVIVPQASEALRAIALRVYSYSLLIEGQWDELLPMLAKNAALIGPEELTRYAKTAQELGKVDEAAKIEALVPRPRLANDFA